MNLLHCLLSSVYTHVNALCPNSIGIFMMKNMMTQTFSNQVPKFRDVHHVWVKTFSKQRFLKCDCLLYKR